MIITEHNYLTVADWQMVYSPSSQVFVQLRRSVLIFHESKRNFPRINYLMYPSFLKKILPSFHFSSSAVKGRNKTVSHRHVGARKTIARRGVLQGTIHRPRVDRVTFLNCNRIIARVPFESEIDLHLLLCLGLFPYGSGGFFTIYESGGQQEENAARKAKRGREHRRECHALLVRPTRANIQRGYAILWSMPLAYLEYDPKQGDHGSVRVRIPPLRRAPRSITRDTRSKLRPVTFHSKTGPDDRTRERLETSGTKWFPSFDTFFLLVVRMLTLMPFDYRVLQRKITWLAGFFLLWGRRYINKCDEC